MNGVIGMTDLLLAPPVTAELAEYDEIIRRSGDALLGVINDVLDFSKIESRVSKSRSLRWICAPWWRT